MCCLSIRGCHQAPHHTPQIAGRGESIWLLGKIPEDCNGSSINGKFCSQNGDGWCRWDTSPGGTNSSLASVTPAGSRNPNLACLAVLLLVMGLQSFCVYWSPMEVCLQLKHGSDRAGVGSSPNRGGESLLWALVLSNARSCFWALPAWLLRSAHSGFPSWRLWAETWQIRYFRILPTLLIRFHSRKEICCTCD